MSAKLIDKAEVSRRTGIPITTLDAWVRLGSVPYVQPGGKGTKVFFSDRVIDELIAKADGAVSAEVSET